MGLSYKIQYKKGSANAAADALSRKPNEVHHVLVVSSLQPSWLSKVVSSYTSDPKAQQLLQQLSISPDSHPAFKLKNGLLLYKNRLWLGHDIGLHSKVFQAFHSSPVGGHSGFPVTYRRIKSLFSWIGMKAFVKDQVQGCQICQQAKPERIPYPVCFLLCQFLLQLGK